MTRINKLKMLMELEYVAEQLSNTLKLLVWYIYIFWTFMWNLPLEINIETKIYRNLQAIIIESFLHYLLKIMEF